MKLYPNVAFYIGLLKPEITGKQQSKTSEKRKKQQLTEKQKSIEYRNTSKMGAQFLHLSRQGEVLSRTTVVDLCQSHHCSHHCHILSLHNRGSQPF